MMLLTTGCHIHPSRNCFDRGVDDPIDRADVGEIAIAYAHRRGMLRKGPLYYSDEVLGPNANRWRNSQHLVVMEDGRAFAPRDDGERMVLALSPTELERLRHDLAMDVGSQQGYFRPRHRVPDDEVQSLHLTFVDVDHGVRGISYECPELQDWTSAAANRLAALRERVLTEGAVDADAPIQVTFSVDSDLIDSRRDAGTWPPDITPPDVSRAIRAEAPWELAYRVYEGSEAARLRNLLGSPAKVPDEGRDDGRGVTVSLPDGTVVAAWWTAVLPWIDDRVVF